jgi:hypothetical protein
VNLPTLDKQGHKAEHRFVSGAEDRNVQIYNTTQIHLYDAVFYGAGESFSFQDYDLLEYNAEQFNKLVLIFRKKTCCHLQSRNGWRQ